MGLSSRSSSGRQPTTSIRGGGPSSRGNWRSRSNIAQASPKPPFGRLLEVVTMHDLTSEIFIGESEVSDATISNVHYLASYNWTRQEEVLMIPGCPPAWSPLSKAQQLSLDSGDYLHDRNAAKSPVHPMEPAVRAVFECVQDIRPQDIDLFACSSTIANLLRFVRGVDKSVRFFVQTVGNTIFFTRRENSPTELIPDVKGYGHKFPEAYTTWPNEVRGSTTHQRLLRYDFAGLHIILRFEADGYLPSKAGPLNASITSTNTVASDDLAVILGGVNVVDSGLHSAATTRSWEIKHAGTRIPQSAIFDLKTRSTLNWNQNVMETEMPRFWTAQLSNFILARHNHGVFNDIQIHDVENDVQKWESENQQSLHQLGSLLHMIISIVKTRSDGKIEINREDDGSLEIREQLGDSHEVLPEELKTQWLSESSGDDIAVANVRSSLNQNSESRDEGISSDKDKKSSGSDVEGQHAYADSDSDSDVDFTRCAETCGYCGHC